MFWWLILFIIGLIIIVISFSKISLHIELDTSPDKRHMKTSLYFLNKIKIFSKNISEENGPNQDQSNSKEDILNQIEKSVEIIFKSFGIIKSYHSLLMKANQKISKGVTSEKFDFITRVGIGDCAATAVLCGIIWSILGNLRMQKNSSKMLTDVNFKVLPDFKKMVFIIHMDCIFTFKTVNIMYVYNLVKKIFEAEKASC